MKLLIIDDDLTLCESLDSYFRAEGHEVDVAYTAAQGLTQASAQSPDCILLDWVLPDACGKDVILGLRRSCDAPIIMVSADHDVHNVVSALKAGADNFLYKPVNLDELNALVKNAGASLHSSGMELSARQHEPLHLRLPSQAMAQVYRQIERIAPFRELCVLIQGETGTGKEHVAKLLHEKCAQPGAPLVEVNCGAIPESLFESEIFGHEAGAFTDAKKRSVGVLEAARGGTVFFDEISELPHRLQGKLLKVIEEKAFRRLGGFRDIRFEARVLAASNRDLNQDVRSGRFREDLFYRLSNYSIHLQPLRLRPEDTEALARFFFKQAKQQRMPPQEEPSLAELLAAMGAYHWPGNIRELKNFVYRFVIDGLESVQAQLPAALAPAGSQSLPSTEKEMKVQLFRDAVLRHGGNKSQAAKEVGVTRQTLAKWLKQVNLIDSPLAQARKNI